MKNKIQIRNRFSGNVIFEYESENNTMKETVETYIENELDSGKSSADLSYADLRSADLSYADLSSADLRSADLSSADLRSAELSYADLRSADLSYANLSSADLSYADLSYADLSYADLRSANLRSANLRSANLRSAKNKETAYIPLNCKWGFSIKGDLIVIGCKEKTIEQWDGFFNSNDIYETRRGTEQFKQIEAVYKACKAYLQHLTAI